MGYPAYPEMKDSGVEWLGRVPGHWDVLAIKRLTSVKRGASPRPIDDPRYFDDEGEFAWVRIADVTASEKYLEETTQRLSEEGKSLSVPLVPGDLFLSIAGSVGKPIISKIKCCIHDGFVYFPSWQQSTEFLYYVFLSGQPYLGLGKMGTQLNLNTDTVGSIKLGLPPTEEQDKVVRFLNHKTAQIDALITKKQALLDKLAEKRTALISQAVTKGLDPSVPMKDSGVEWLGEIPAHWEALLLKRDAKITYGIGGEIDRSLSEGTNLISLPNVTRDGTLLVDENPYCVLDQDERDSALLKKGDLLFNWRNGSTDHLGKTAHFNLDGEWTHVSFLLKIRFDQGTSDPRYFRYLLNGLRVTGFFSSAKAGVNNTFNMNELMNLWVLRPPHKEQSKIANFLDNHCQKIEAMVAKVEAVIHRLAEHRSALITNAVTGKIDVRNYPITAAPGQDVA